jgi:hypothetical protein
MALGWWSRWTAGGRHRAFNWVIGVGLVVIAAGLGVAFRYWEQSRPLADASYRLCVASDQKACPPQTVFVQDFGPDAVVAWVNKECARYKRRETIEEEPTKDCNCALIEVKCTSSL